MRMSCGIIKKLLHSIITIVFFCVLIAPVTINEMLITLTASFILSVIVFFCYDKLEYKIHIHKKIIHFDFLFLIMLLSDFYSRWLPSSKVAVLSSRFGVGSSAFLVLFGSIIGCFAIGFIDCLIWEITKTVCSLTEDNEKVKNTLLYCIIIIMQYVSIQFSSIPSFSKLFQQNIIIFLINIIIMLIFNLIISLIVVNRKLSLLITSFLFFVWSVANYYVINFHGGPLYLSELVNFGAAIAVVQNYSYRLSFSVIYSIISFYSSVICSFHIRSERNFATIKIQLSQLLLTFSLLSIVGFYFINTSKKGNIWTPWANQIRSKGFMYCVVSDLVNSYDPFVMPNGYDISEIESKDESVISENSNKPDIILILNETFYDLNYYTAIDMDKDSLQDYYSISNAYYGYAISPNVGGLTNNSEFELLFSKSMYLLKGASPFTYLASNLLSRNTITYLENLGYISAGMHCGGETNYSRNVAYPAIGFDNIYLGPDDFNHIEKNGNRSWLDSGNYKDLIEYYENTDSNNPQFIYMLTFQNHGGYELNDDSMDTVHIRENYGDLSDDLNEYLSSIELSSKSFKELISYLSGIERDVIVCMVGDHSPSFITQLNQRDDVLIPDEQINMRLVPYVFWANYDANFSRDYEYSSMVDIMPLLLDAAELPLSSFFKKIVDLHDVLPIRTSDGKSVNQTNTLEEYNENNSYFELWENYFYLEYNSLMDDEEYLEHLFLPNN